MRSSGRLHTSPTDERSAPRRPVCEQHAPALSHVHEQSAFPWSISNLPEAYLPGRPRRTRGLVTCGSKRGCPGTAATNHLCPPDVRKLSTLSQLQLRKQCRASSDMPRAVAESYHLQHPGCLGGDSGEEYEMVLFSGGTVPEKLPRSMVAKGKARKRVCGFIS